MIYLGFVFVKKIINKNKLSINLFVNFCKNKSKNSKEMTVNADKTCIVVYRKKG